jgi:hypothetical protein
VWNNRYRDGERALYIEIERSVLTDACKEMIETILFCLPNARKGTIYRIGRPPELIAERIASGIIEDDTGNIKWGLPAISEYNPPGKPWAEYRDQSGRPLEAMAWCVERQKSWTAEDPNTNLRSVRLQVEGKGADFHHMEPVLVRKSDLKRKDTPEYPSDYNGNTLWKDSQYVVVAVIKIHFRPFTIKIGSHETRVIKRLSRSLGTELLSYQLQHDSMRAIEGLARDRLNACNLLADTLRNAITKTGIVFNLVKKEIGYLRDQWEGILLEERKERNGKVEAIRNLNALLQGLGEGHEELKKNLTDTQNRFLTLSLPPQKGENWVMRQIEKKWLTFLDACPQDSHTQMTLWETIDALKRSLYFGQNAESIAKYDKIPEDVKLEWIELLYQDNDRFDGPALARLIKILDNPSLNIPSRLRSQKTLTQLKALAETMSQLERHTNVLLHQILNGSMEEPAAENAPAASLNES